MRQSFWENIAIIDDPRLGTFAKKSRPTIHFGKICHLLKWMTIHVEEPLPKFMMNRVLQQSFGKFCHRKLGVWQSNLGKLASDVWMYDKPNLEKLAKQRRSTTIHAWKLCQRWQSNLGKIVVEDDARQSIFGNIVSWGWQSNFWKNCRLRRMRDNPYLEILSFKCLLLNRL